MARELTPGTANPRGCRRLGRLSPQRRCSFAGSFFFFPPCGKGSVGLEGGEAGGGEGLGCLRQGGVAVPTSAVGCWPQCSTGHRAAAGMERAGILHSQHRDDSPGQPHKRNQQNVTFSEPAPALNNADHILQREIFLTSVGVFPCRDNNGGRRTNLARMEGNRLKLSRLRSN